MAWIGKTWQDTPSIATPLQASAVNDFETRIGNAFSQIWALDSAISGPAGRGFLPTGAKLMNMSRRTSPLTNQAPLASGTLYVFPLGLLCNGDTLSSITFISGTTALVTGTHQWAGIVRLSDLNLRAVSADATNAAWAASTAKTFTFGAAYTPTADETMLGCLLVAATTMPSLYGIAQANTVLTSGPTIVGSSNTGLTAPLAVGTVINAITAGTILPFAYAS